MPSVVLDVNIIVSGFFRGKGSAVAIAGHWEHGNLDVALSDHIISQVLDVCPRPFFAARSAEIDRQLVLKLMRADALVVEPDPSVSGVCDDAEDDLVLGTVVAANADYLVMGDKGLLQVGEYRGVRIVDAAGFLKLIHDELTSEP